MQVKIPHEAIRASDPVRPRGTIEIEITVIATVMIRAHRDGREREREREWGWTVQYIPTVDIHGTRKPRRQTPLSLSLSLGEHAPAVCWWWGILIISYAADTRPESARYLSQASIGGDNHVRPSH
jgi:hypothetical protein